MAKGDKPSDEVGHQLRKVNRFTLEPTTASLTVLREFIRTALVPFSVTEPIVFDIVAATHEAAKNAVVHNPESESPVDVVCEVREDIVVVEVSDRGGGFEMESIPPEAPDPHSPAGRGLYLIYSLMDEVETESDESGTRVRMHKRIASRAVG